MTVRSAAARLLPALLLLAAFACGREEHTVEVVSPGSTKETVLRVAVSDEAVASFRRLTEAYVSSQGVRFEVVETQSKNALDLVEANSVDFAVTSRHLKDEIVRTGLNYVPFAYDGAVYAATTSAKVRSISKDGLRGLLSGKIRNWKEVGGADLPVRVICRPEGSSITKSLSSLLFGGKPPSVRCDMSVALSEEAVTAALDNKGALVPLALSRALQESSRIVPLTVGSMAPILSNTTTAPYPSQLEIGLVFRKDAVPAVAAFTNHLLGVDGMHEIASLGLTPASTRLSVASCHCRSAEGSFSPSSPQGISGQFVLAVVPEMGAVRQEERYAGISKAIAEGLSINVRLRHMESYKAVAREFAEGRVDGAFVGSLLYGQLREQTHAVPVARPEREGGISGYRSFVIVPASSPARSFADLRGKAVASVPDTMAGELYPRLLASREGRSLENHFGRWIKASSHDEVVRLVESGKVDGGAVKDVVFAKMIRGNLAREKAFRIISTSDSVPDTVLVVSSDFDDRLRTRLLNVLVGLDKTSAGRDALAKFGAVRFMPTVHDDYGALYAMARDAGYELAVKPR